MTPEQVEEFQRAHTNHLGQPLVVDGSPGPQTRWAMAFATLCQARRMIVTTAQSYIGLAEDPPGSNSDPEDLIANWLGRCGAPLVAPWCAAFACSCLANGVSLPVRVAGAQALGKRFPATVSPFPGDVMWFPTTAGYGHCGVVVGVAPLEVLTIEGNCANAVRCVRRSRAELRFSRTVDDVTGTCPGIVPTVPPPPKGTR
jgi:hypothetical protein